MDNVSGQVVMKRRQKNRTPVTVESPGILFPSRSRALREPVRSQGFSVWNATGSGLAPVQWTFAMSSARAFSELLETPSGIWGDVDGAAIRRARACALVGSYEDGRFPLPRRLVDVLYLRQEEMVPRAAGKETRDRLPRETAFALRAQVH